MSRGHGRVQNAILSAVLSSPYGYTVRGLAGLVYPGHPPTEAGLVAVRRAVRALLDEGIVIEQIRYDGERLIVRATEPKRRRPSHRTPTRDHQSTGNNQPTGNNHSTGNSHSSRIPRLLQCLPCDVQWWDGDGEHTTCWRCDKPGVPAPG